MKVSRDSCGDTKRQKGMRPEDQIRKRKKGDCPKIAVISRYLVLIASRRHQRLDLKHILMCQALLINDRGK
jgi:hypothetical protein